MSVASSLINEGNVSGTFLTKGLASSAGAACPRKRTIDPVWQQLTSANKVVNMGYILPRTLNAITIYLAGLSSPVWENEFPLQDNSDVAHH